jgi:iron complex outermembrane receptor protein
VRTPSRAADDLTLTTAFGDTGLLAGGPPSGTFVPLQVVGDPGLDSEELLAYEVGYRLRATDTLTFDLATFYNSYDDLITFPTPAGTFGNRGEADTYGLELAGTWDAAKNWTLMASYSFLVIDFESPDGNSEEGESPEHQFNIRSYLDITEDLEFNAALYYVDNIPDEGAASYVRLDLGLTWRPTDNVEVALWGQNLLDDKHLEFGDDLFQATPLEIERSFYAQVTLRF